MISVTLSEKEILSNPNYYQLGELVYKYYHAAKDLEKQNRDEHVVLQIGENGTVNAIGEFDECVECGKNTPYTQYTSIDLRIGYIEGAGQGCFQPHTCGKYKELTRGLH